MPRYEWVGDGEFRDHRSGQTVASGETVDLPEHVGGPNDELARVEEADVDVSEDGVDTSHNDDADLSVSDGQDDAEEGEDEDICGYEKDDGTLCQRNAGWGRDADSGRCSDHLEE